MTSHELRILSVKSRKENLRLSREHELRIWDEAEIIKKKKKKKNRENQNQNQNEVIKRKQYYPQTSRSREQRGRGRDRLCEGKNEKKENPEHSFRHREEWWEGKKKKKFRGEIVRMRDIQYYREGELEWGRELCSSNIRVMIWSRPKRHFFFLYTQSLWYRTTWKSL